MTRPFRARVACRAVLVGGLAMALGALGLVLSPPSRSPKRPFPP